MDLFFYWQANEQTMAAAAAVAFLALVKKNTTFPGAAPYAW